MSGFHCHNSEFNSEERSKNFMEVLESFGKFWEAVTLKTFVSTLFSWPFL